MPPEQFRALGHHLVDWIADYLSHVETRPVRPAVQPGDLLGLLPQDPPERGEAWNEILGDLDRLIVPGLTHWQSPNFFGYFPANCSAPAILGDLVSTGLGVNGMLWATSPAATELEMRVLDWLGRAIGLPEVFMCQPRGGVPANGGGVIQGTASEATLVALVAARARAMKRHAAKAATSEVADRLVMYASTQAHSSIVKAAMIAGLAAHPEDRRRVRLIDTDAEFAMDAAALQRQMAADDDAGLVPFYVCATVGTTSSTANDPLPAIGAACARHGAWLHVDAAMAGAACICPEHRGLIAGVEHADSFCFNPHKWLLTNFDCDCLWTRDRQSVLDALSITPEYLRTAAGGATGSTPVFDYRDWQIPLGRRFRALKLWFVLRHYGIEGLRMYIREHLRLAELFEGWVRADARFEVVAPRTISLVCFRLRPRPGETAEQTDARNRDLLERINASGRALLSHTVLSLPGRGKAYILRMAIGGTLTQERHVRATWGLIGELAGSPEAG
jgi:aromatic-L-amino-acid decarboxylase